MRSPKEWAAYTREACETMDPVSGSPAVDWQRFEFVVEDLVGSSHEQMTSEIIAALRVCGYIEAQQRSANCVSFKPQHSVYELKGCLDAASPIAAIGPWRNRRCPWFAPVKG